MKRNWTAADFERDLTVFSAEYDDQFAIIAAQLRADYAEKSPDPDGELDKLLESHVRVFIDALLASLNWQTGVRAPGRTNLVPEAPLRSGDRSSVRFLDYLGFEGGQPKKPLLIVEAKRPSSNLPRTRASGNGPEEPATALIKGLAGAQMTEDWSEWLRTARDYVRSTTGRADHPPKRMVITNGDWLITFTNPYETFCQDRPDLRTIRVFSNRVDVLRDYADVFELLEHQQVLGDVPPLAVEELAFYATSADVDRILHGLRLIYQVDEDFFAAAPSIKVMPVLHLRTRLGFWLVVEERMVGEALPKRPDDLAGHFDKVSSRARELLSKAHAVLGVSLAPTKLAQHYQESEPAEYPVGLLGIRRVWHPRAEEYLIATGSHTHFFTLTPTVAECPFHRTEETGNVPLGIPGQTMDPRSFFIIGQDQRCCHIGAHQGKRTPLRPENRARCGPRSNPNMEPFCEIFRFEEYLCCRTCAFEEVCTRAQVFVLPCTPTNSD